MSSRRRSHRMPAEFLGGKLDNVCKSCCLLSSVAAVKYVTKGGTWREVAKSRAVWGAAVLEKARTLAWQWWTRN